MKNTLLALTLLASAAVATAHPYPTTHYHTADGRFVIGNQIAPRTSTNYVVDGNGNNVRVVTTVRCTNSYINPRTNELTCTEEQTTEQRFVETYNDNYRPGYGVVSPVYVDPIAPFYFGGGFYDNNYRNDFRGNRRDGGHRDDRGQHFDNRVNHDNHGDDHNNGGGNDHHR